MVQVKFPFSTIYVNTINFSAFNKKFRIYLKEKYNVSQAYIFIGYMPGNENLYKSLQKYGYVLNFKPFES